VRQAWWGDAHPAGHHALDDAGAEAQVVVWPAGGDGDPASLTHRWSFTPDEAEQLARMLQDAADRARSMI
jgi:hypothetical protein